VLAPALAVLAPALAAIAVAIRATDGGPVFFRQVRVGREGEIFLVWKFRTMVIDAEKLKAQLTGQDEGNGADRHDAGHRVE
jgi:lipopolysaccharide/colanic/teichoic acid biosynthesis glycosyltransferase